MKAILSVLVVVAGVSPALADGFPISGVFGTPEGCASWKSGGEAAVYASGGNDVIVVTPSTVVEPSRLCSVVAFADGFAVDCRQARADGPALHYINGASVEARPNQSIWYTERQAGELLQRCD